MEDASGTAVGAIPKPESPVGNVDGVEETVKNRVDGSVNPTELPAKMPSRNAMF